jgi:transposase
VPEPHTASQVERLKRAAKKLARQEGIPHSSALDRLAHELGYRNWSLLQKHAVPPNPPLHRTPDDPVTEHNYMSKLSQQKTRVLDAFEARTDDWTFGDFERALEESMGSRYRNYQDAKMTIIEADRDGRWPKTVEQWIRSNHKAFGNLPVEMNPIGAKYDLSK